MLTAWDFFHFSTDPSWQLTNRAAQPIAKKQHHSTLRNALKLSVSECAMLQIFATLHTNGGRQKLGEWIRELKNMWFRKTCYRPPKMLVYVTVHKTRRKGRVVKTDYWRVFGTEEQMQETLEHSQRSRKVRKSSCFSKGWDVHWVATCLSMYSYNFYWAVQMLWRPDGQKEPCDPAIAAAGLIDHIWTIKEWLYHPACQG